MINGLFVKSGDKFRCDPACKTFIFMYCRLPGIALAPNMRYERVMEAFGGKGYYVETREALKANLTECLAIREPCLINCMISTLAQKKPQVL